MHKGFSAAAGILAGGIVIWVLSSQLEIRACFALGILSWAIVWWVFKVLPDYLTAILMGVLFIMIAKVPMQIVFSAFSGSTFWLLLSAFGLSLGIAKSGLLRRLSLFLLRLFPRSFIGQLVGLTTIGFFSAPFIPSMSAKAAILAPLSLEISDSLGFAHRGKEASGLFAAMLVGLRTPGPLFISASVLGYAFVEQYPPEIRAQFNMGKWFLAAFPWFFVVTIMTVLLIWLRYKPARRVEASAWQTDLFATMEPMTRAEKMCALLTVTTMLLWATESRHSIPPQVISLFSLSLMLALNIVSTEEFQHGMNWTSLLFIGMILGIAPVFSSLKINDWMLDMFRPLLLYFSRSSLLFLVCIAVSVVILRFVVVSEVTLVNILMPLLVSISHSIGVNPWVTGFVVYAVINPWFFLYQNPVYMTATYAVNQKMITHREAARFCLYYQCICLLGVVLSYPYWKMLGILA